MPGPVYDDCPGCDGIGKAVDWTTGNEITCPYCKGLGTPVVSRNEEKERRRRERMAAQRNYLGSTERLEKRLLSLGLGILLVYILFVCTLIGAIIALLVHFL